MFQSDGHLILALLIKDNLEAASVVIDFEKGTHRLLLLAGDTTHYNDLQLTEAKNKLAYRSVKIYLVAYLIYCITIDLANIIGAR